MSRKIKWYASINRAKNSSTGTKIRLSAMKHFKVLKFLQLKYEDILDLQKSNPEELPTILVDKKDWDILRGELKAGHGVNFTRVFMNTTEFCIICDKQYRNEIESTILLSEEAQKQREAKAKKEEEE